MNSTMLEISGFLERRTTADVVFEHLYNELQTLTLLPGTKVSESETAKRLGVSRQPVRDAFARLSTLDLLLIRPQKATEVRGFSMQRILHDRFVRLAVELEVIRSACAVWDDIRAAELQINIVAQRKALDMGDTAEFDRLDFEFHSFICELAGHPLASETIDVAKRAVDRLRHLTDAPEREAEFLWNDHCRLADALRHRDEATATAAIRMHLSRIEGIISDVHKAHPEYFE